MVMNHANANWARLDQREGPDSIQRHTDQGRGGVEVAKVDKDMTLPKFPRPFD